ncbi:MAG: hypothetical protein C4293_15400 [Nitrospiraceae bacterium]
MGCLTLPLFLLLVALLPLAFGQLFATALLKLRLEPGIALLLAIAMIIGGAINIPVKRITRCHPVAVDPLAIFGLMGWWPRFQYAQRETIIAVNVGGCLVPVSLALYEIGHLVLDASQSLTGLGVALAVNTAVCYWLARPMPGIGIALPGLVPPIAAVLCAVWFTPEQATPVAFTAGVLGPLIGADLLHLRDIAHVDTGIVSIGGAGTFDGIVLSGVVAAYLA